MMTHVVNSMRATESKYSYKSVSLICQIVNTLSSGVLTHLTCFHTGNNRKIQQTLNKMHLCDDTVLRILYFLQFGWH